MLEGRWIPPARPGLVLTTGALLSGLLTASCGRQQETAQLRYAHARAAAMVGSPLGHLEIIDQDLSRKFDDNLRVCVQKSGDTSTDQYRLLETKLAHAMWFAHSGYNRDAFGRLRFELASSCAAADAKYMTIVIFGDLKQEKQGDNFGELFKAATMSCQTDDQGITCKGDSGLTLGWGGPATIGTSFYQSAPERWVNTSRVLPGSIKLSPHVDWMPLSYELTVTETSQSSSRMNLVTRYENLVKSAQTVSLDELTAFGAELERAKALGSQDKMFRKEMEALATAGGNVAQHVYRPRLASFHTLLHEVGHTFGMSHADHPGGDTVTGQSESTSCDANGVCTTSQSAMAYGDFYNYLTADDQAGIKAASLAVKKEILSHK